MVSVFRLHTVNVGAQGFDLEFTPKM